MPRNLSVTMLSPVESGDGATSSDPSTILGGVAAMAAQSSAKATDATLQSSTTSDHTGTSTTSVVPPEAKKPKAAPRAKPYPKGESTVRAPESVGPVPNAVPHEFAIRLGSSKSEPLLRLSMPRWGLRFFAEYVA